MVLEQGEKLHVIARMNFEGDLRRHFIGEVVDIDRDFARVEGHLYILDKGTGTFVRRKDKRVRLFGLADAKLIVNVLPAKADLAKVVYAQTEDRGLVVTDGSTFALDINEFGPGR